MFLLKKNVRRQEGRRRNWICVDVESSPDQRFSWHVKELEAKGALNEDVERSL